MKKTLLILSFCGALALNAGAADAYSIATVDLRKVFDNYWRTKQADARLKEDAADMEKDRKSLVEQFQTGEVNYKRLLDSANDPAISAAERDKRAKDAENELLGLRDIDARMKQFDTTARVTLGEKQRRIRDNILSEIRDTIKAKIKGGNYSLVIDSAAETPNGTPIILFSSGSDDITDAVLTQLNLNAPPAAPAR